MTDWFGHVFATLMLLVLVVLFASTIVGIVWPIIMLIYTATHA